MQDMTEIRWHARAGQGAVTAANLLAETAVLSGNYIQAMPEYGPERTGAPLRAYTRISPAPIEVNNNITNPNIVVVLDETLLPIVNVLDGLAADGTVVINSKLEVDEARAALNAPQGVKVAVVDASGIALDTLRRDLPNTPIVGALAQVTGCASVDKLKENLLLTFSQRFSQAVVDANLVSVERAVSEVKVG